jgi:peptidoglycan/LPS O-acetylase OafA/YrhL
MSNSTGRRIPSLDGIRAISIQMVLYGHLCGTRHFPVTIAEYGRWCGDVCAECWGSLALTPTYV